MPQRSRYAYVVEKFPDVATEVVDLLKEMPMEAPYNTLKNAILHHTDKKTA